MIKLSQNVLRTEEVYECAVHRTIPSTFYNCSLAYCHRYSTPSVQHTVKPSDTKTSEFGAKKGLLQALARETGSSTLKHPNSQKVLSKSPFLGKVKEGHGQLLQASWCQVTVSSDAPVYLPNERYSLF